MSNEPNPSPPDPEPLDYETPPRRDRVSLPQFVGGTIVGAFVVGAVGLVGFGAVASGGPQFRPRRSWELPVIFFATMIVAALFVRPAYRRRNEFFAGLLAGVAVMGLIEGLCFTIG